MRTVSLRRESARMPRHRLTALALTVLALTVLALATLALATLAACSDVAAPPPAPRTLPLPDIATGPPTAVLEWTAYDLGSLGPNEVSEATAINNDGMIVGWSSNPDRGPGSYPFEHPLAVVFVRGAAKPVTSLGTLLGASASQAMAVNDAGVVVGWSGVFAGSSTTQTFAFVHDPAARGGRMSKIPPPSGTLGFMQATGINNANVVVGWYQRSANAHDASGTPLYERARAFKWTVGSSAIVDLPQPVGMSGRANAINDAGEIVGQVWATPQSIDRYGDEIAQRASHAFRWNGDGSTTDLHEAASKGNGAFGSWATSIAETGFVGGDAPGGKQNELSPYRGFVRERSAATWTTFPNRGITGVTASRLVEGGGATSERVSGLWRPWKNLHGPAGSSTFATSANGVNRCGDIVGLFRANDPYQHAALWKHAWCDAPGRPGPGGQ
jgi:uncharacterized membrane protein